MNAWMIGLCAVVSVVWSDVCLQRGGDETMDVSLHCRRTAAGGLICDRPLTDTPTPTPTNPPTPTPPGGGGTSVCAYALPSTYTDLGSSWDLSLSDHAYPRIQLAYNAASGSSSVLCGSGYGYAIPGAATITSIGAYNPLFALPNNLTTPFLPTGVDCDHWATEGTLTLARLRDETGTQVGTDKADSRTMSTYGGLLGDFSTDLWGTAWTPTKVNSANFGICARASTWTTSTDQHDCDIYHIVSSGNPALFPEIGATMGLFVCYTTP